MAGKEIPISQEKIDEILKAITCQEYDFIRAISFGVDVIRIYVGR